MWKLPVLEVKAQSTGADTDVVAVFQDAGKKLIPPQGAYATLGDKMRKTESFAANRGSSQFVRFGGNGTAGNVLFIGLGQGSELTEEKIRSSGGSLWTKLQTEKSKSAVVYVDTLSEGRGADAGPYHTRLARVFAEGMILGAYQFDKYKSKKKAEPGKADEYFGPTKITFVTQDKNLKKQLEADFEQVLAVGEAVSLTRDFSNEPSNYGTPEYYATECQRVARANGIKCTILTEKEAAREKMGLFLAVGQGSDREGRIVVLEYTPTPSKGGKSSKNSSKNIKTLALVGKGVTFDSGGISIKPSARMEEMKHDMTGAATVMGAVLLASRWQVPNRIVAIMAFTENMPGGDAIQPGNVITARNGKTVEIINTDAEGRLILADVLDYAHDFKPDAIVNVATLTGAVSVALGKQCCGIMGNDDALVDTIRRAGDSHGERIWQLPLFDEYFEDMKSDYADMRNSCNDGAGGTIRGGIFLKQFIRKGMRWAHLDIAAMAWNITHLSYIPKKGASGLYVRTLAQLAADL